MRTKQKAENVQRGIVGAGWRVERVLFGGGGGLICYSHAEAGLDRVVHTRKKKERKWLSTDYA